MKCFGWTQDHVDFEITGAQGWAYYAWAKVNEASLLGGGLEPVEGYVAQEVKKRK